jgi:hypothetical protein
MPSSPELELPSIPSSGSPVASGELGCCLGCTYEPNQSEVPEDVCRFDIKLGEISHKQARIRVLFYAHATNLPIRNTSGNLVAWDQRNTSGIINLAQFIEVALEEEKEQPLIDRIGGFEAPPPAKRPRLSEVRPSPLKGTESC